VPDLIFHRGQVRVQIPQQDTDERQQDPAVNKALALRHRATGTALTATKRRTPLASKARRMPRVALEATGPSLRPARANSRDRGITGFQRGAQRLGVGQFGHRHHLERGMIHVEPGRIADHRRHLVPRIQRLSYDLPANAAARSEDRYLHLVLLHLKLSGALHVSGGVLSRKS